MVFKMNKNYPKKLNPGHSPVQKKVNLYKNGVNVDWLGLPELKRENIHSLGMCLKKWDIPEYNLYFLPYGMFINVRLRNASLAQTQV